MNDLCRVNVLQPAQGLIQKVLEVIVAQGLVRSDDLAEIGVHEVGNDVHIVELILCRRSHDISDLQDLNAVRHEKGEKQDDFDTERGEKEPAHVFVSEQALQLDFAQKTFGVRHLVERVGDFLDRDLVTFGQIFSRTSKQQFVSKRSCRLTNKKSDMGHTRQSHTPRFRWACSTCNDSHPARIWCPARGTPESSWLNVTVLVPFFSLSGAVWNQNNELFE
jgi:hypothetical protein